MKSNYLLLSAALLITQSVFAVNMYYPGNTDGQTAVDQSTTPPQYYPPANPNPINPNKNLPSNYKQNTNIHGNIQMPPPGPASQ